MVSNVKFIDVQRREIVTETISKDGVQTLAVEKQVPGGSTKRIMLLNKYDALRLKDELERFLHTLYSNELNGMNTTLSPVDMVDLFGEDKEDLER